MYVLVCNFRLPDLGNSSADFDEIWQIEPAVVLDSSRVLGEVVPRTPALPSNGQENSKIGTTCVQKFIADFRSDDCAVCNNLVTSCVCVTVLVSVC